MGRSVLCLLACYLPINAPAIGTAPLGTDASVIQSRQTPHAKIEGSQHIRLSPAQVVAIDRYVRAEMGRERIPGVQVGIYSEGRILLARGYGLANVELNVPMKPFSMMKAGSVGKQFTATAILMLVEQGKLQLSDSVLDHFPELPVSWKPITIANLLSHTSGITDYFQRSNYLHLTSSASGDLFDVTTDMSDDALVGKVAQLPLEFPIGTRFSYSNTNYLLLGILIHRLTGQSRIAYARQHIFAPAGMTTARGLSNDDLIPNRASGYVMAGGVLTNERPVSDTFNATADGGLYLNVLDLADWDGALSGTALLKQSSLDKMWTPFRLADGKPNPANYGFGWFGSSENGHRLIAHGGDVSGFNCVIQRYPDDKITVVVMNNLDGTHASAYQMGQVVAGLAKPALMPAPMKPIPDSKPEIGALALSTLVRLTRNQNVSDSFAPEAHYVFDPIDGADTLGQLPRGWKAMKLSLIQRKSGGHDPSGFISDYRLGNRDDSRVISVQTAASGKLLGIFVLPDRDRH